MSSGSVVLCRGANVFEKSGWCGIGLRIDYQYWNRVFILKIFKFLTTAFFYWIEVSASIYALICFRVNPLMIFPSYFGSVL